jgi:TatD DNase family protein
MITLIDTHAHLCDDQFSQDRQEVLKRAGDQGVRAIVEIADSPRSWESAKNFSQNALSRHNAVKVFWSCGFHPHYADEQEGFNFDTMEERASPKDCLAVGEIGLDYAKSSAGKETQISLFLKSLEVASEVNKPVVIHCRKAQGDALRILRSFYGGVSRSDFSTGVIHCFSGDLHFAEGCMDLGFYLGVDGPITYPNSRDLVEVISRVPLDRIVLETDSPYLPPQDSRGKRNESSYLVRIAEKLSEISGRSLDEIARVTTENALRLFRIKNL